MLSHSAMVGSQQLALFMKNIFINNDLLLRNGKLIIQLLKKCFTLILMFYSNYSYSCISLKRASLWRVYSYYTLNCFPVWWPWRHCIDFRLLFIFKINIIHTTYNNAMFWQKLYLLNLPFQNYHILFLWKKQVK